MTTFFITFAPVKNIAPDYASSMPQCCWGYSLILRRIFGQNTDETQVIVKSDVSKGEGDVTPVKNPAFIRCIYQSQPTE
ncbi:hypothetical protein E0L21_04380 [Kosakonia quasisacchari]|uniref:Uncharacterized protein n=1 Tax=Kosakonia quasisacchari TaxID=2529380 RepID=A0A4R0HSA5_9ENTR|nr:hypothetical protein E0L21_04380 [Kosakonia quasisacchari]